MHVILSACHPNVLPSARAIHSCIVCMSICHCAWLLDFTISGAAGSRATWAAGRAGCWATRAAGRRRLQGVRAAGRHGQQGDAGCRARGLQGDASSRATWAEGRAGCRVTWAAWQGSAGAAGRREQQGDAGRRACGLQGDVGSMAGQHAGCRAARGLQGVAARGLQGGVLAGQGKKRAVPTQPAPGLRPACVQSTCSLPVRAAHCCPELLLLLLLSAAAAACPTRNRAALPSALPARERASCPREPLRPCPLALPASSLRPAVRCCCCHLRGPSCCMRCCCYLLLLLSATAAAERDATATAAASLLLLAAAAATCCSCRSLLLLLHAAAAPCRCCSLLLLLLAASAPCCCCSLLPVLLATAATGGGASGSAGSFAGAGGAGGATGSAGGAAGAGGAGPTTDHHCLSWPLSRQLQRLGVDSGGHCLSRTTPPLSSFASGFFSEPVQVVEALVFYVLHRGDSRAAALGASEYAAALCASESAAALGASESAAALGARASPATGPSSAEALHTFTLDSGASRCFFCDCTTLTPLAAPVPVSLADPTGGPVVARASTFLPCPAVPSGSLSGFRVLLNLPTFSMSLVSNAAIQDVWVDTFIPRGQRVAICTCSRTGCHLATFTRRLGSSFYTLTTTSAQVAESGQVATSSQVSASSQLAASCSCRVLSHQTLLSHHRLGHPSLPHLRSMHSRLLISGLPRSLPSLLRSLALPCLPCVEGRQRAAPHSSEFPPTTAPLQTLHMDIWGPAPVGGMDQESYFLLVVDDYTRYTTVFPLHHKADVRTVLIPWICATHRQLRDRCSRDLPVSRLHSDKGGEFSSDLLAEFCRDEGICLSFTLLASP
ncbi:unnamed protein product [Closterium sp. NIES-54]